MSFGERKTSSDVVHFIYPKWPNTRPLSFVNYVSVRLAAQIQKPKEIKFWIEDQPDNNEWWDAIKPLVTIVHRPMPREFGGTKIEWPQYSSDVLRLQILQEEGGIYLDTDMLMLKQVYRPILVPPDAHDWFWSCEEPSATGSAQSMCNAFMQSTPQHPFLQAWLNAIPDAMQSSTWAEGGVVLPYKLSRNFKDVYIGSSRLFCPLDLSDNWMFSTDPKTIEFAQRHIEMSFSVHIFETYWRDVIKDITPEWCKNNDSLFSRIVRRNFII